MRKYTLASSDARLSVDLRGYAAIIEAAVHEVMPTATVLVERDCYYVSPTPVQRDAVRIGRAICKSALKKHCIQIPKLFSSIEIKEEKMNGTEEQPRSGGHF